MGTRREFSVAAAARSAKLVDDHDDDLVDSDVDSDEEEDDIVETLRKDGDDGVKDDKLSVTWPPGTPPPGRKQRLGEMWAQMEHHGRGTRKVMGRVTTSYCTSRRKSSLRPAPQCRR